LHPALTSGSGLHEAFELNTARAERMVRQRLARSQAGLHGAAVEWPRVKG